MPEPVGGVRELRLVVAAPDFDDALRFYRDVLGLRELAVLASPAGRACLEAVRATLELTDPAHAAFVDEVEVGRRAASTSGSRRGRGRARRARRGRRVGAGRAGAHAVELAERPAGGSGRPSAHAARAAR